MLERAHQLSERLKFDPAKTGLGWWLAAINVAIVLLVVGGISFSAIGMLRDLADEQGKARVQLAGAVAREDLRRFGEDSVTAAHVLADRPTLQRLLSEDSTDALALFLRRFCQTEAISACAVFQGSALLAQAGEPLPWNDIVTASTEQGESFLAAPPGSPFAVLGAGASFGEGKEARVYIVRNLDAPLARTLAQHVGLAIRLINYRTFAAAPVDPFTALHSSGLADGHSAVQRITALDLYASSVPVFASTGEAIALIEARLPAAAIDQATSHLARRLQVTALVLAILAVLAGIMLGQMVAAPVRALTAAAVRLGQGDFSTSIPPGGAAEVGTLARTMEDMRRNLVDLTSTLRRREAEAQAVLSGIVEGVYAVDKKYDPLFEPAGRAPAQYRHRRCGRALLRRRVEALRRQRTPPLRLRVSDFAGTRDRQCAARRKATDERRRGAHDGHRQLDNGRWTTGAGDPRRDGARSCAPRPRYRTRQHLA